MRSSKANTELKREREVMDFLGCCLFYCFEAIYICIDVLVPSKLKSSWWILQNLLSWRSVLSCTMSLNSMHLPTPPLDFWKQNVPFKAQSMRPVFFLSVSLYFRRGETKISTQSSQTAVVKNLPTSDGRQALLEL